MLACPGCALMERLKIDDPVGCVPTHAFAGVWGLIAVSLFAERDTLEERFSHSYGLLKGGPWRFVGIQLLMIIATGSWAAILTFLELLLVDKLIGLRMSLEHEMLGADLAEHTITHWAPRLPIASVQDSQADAAEAHAQDNRGQTVSPARPRSKYRTSEDAKDDSGSGTAIRKAFSRVTWSSRKSVDFHRKYSHTGSVSGNSESHSKCDYRNGGFVEEDQRSNHENSTRTPAARTDASLEEN